MSEIKTVEDWHRAAIEYVKAMGNRDLTTIWPANPQTGKQEAQQWRVWDEYFYAKGFKPWAFTASISGQLNSMTVPCKFPNQMDAGFVRRSYQMAAE